MYLEDKALIGMAPAGRPEIQSPEQCLPRQVRPKFPREHTLYFLTAHFFIGKMSGKWTRALGIKCPIFLYHFSLEDSKKNAENNTKRTLFFAAESRSKADDISSLPLDAKLVPKQLIKGQAEKNTPSLASTALAVTTAVNQGKKKAKKSTEKKQERKAAKTLSAILLAFILTWLPYSVLVLIKPILPRELNENVIINTIWEWSYYLCYINSTINPMLYALCNASFRRTYIRILTCRFGTQPRQPVNRYYYG